MASAHTVQPRGVHTVKNKKKRKPRTVKNGYIDITDVTQDCGPNYNYWISVSKQKLKVEAQTMSVYPMFPNNRGTLS